MELQHITTEDSKTSLIQNAEKNVNDTDDLNDPGSFIQNSNKDPLFTSVSQGNEETARSLIEMGTDICVTDEHGNTPLMYAIHNRLSNIANLLITKGCDVSVENCEKKSALHIAVESRQTDLVKLLVEKGTSVNSRDSSGKTPFSRSVKDGSKDIACFLLKNGADINTVDDLGNNPLIDAIETNQLPIAEYLIKKGCDLNFQNPNTKATALHLSIDQKHMKSEDGDSMTEQINTCKNVIKIAELLIKTGSDVNLQDKNGNTSLHLALKCSSVINDNALKKKYLKLAELLIKNQCDVNIQNNEKDTPFHILAKSDNADIALIKLLIKKGANVNAEDANGSTVLLCLLNRHHDKCVKFLLKSDIEIDVNKFNDSGNNALNAAVESRRKDILKKLIEKGADVNARNQKNQIALLFATSHSGMVQLLLENGSEVDVMDTKERTPLYLACTKCNVKVCEMMLSAGADPNLGCLQSRNFYTTLVKFSGSALSEVVKMLLKYGWRCHLYPIHEKYPGLLCAILTDPHVELNNENQILLNLAYLAGSSRQHQLLSLLVDKDYVKYWEAFPQKKKWLTEKCRKPMSLKNITRITILTHLRIKPNKMININSLDIPQSLKLFLQFQHVA